VLTFCDESGPPAPKDGATIWSIDVPAGTTITAGFVGFGIAAGTTRPVATGVKVASALSYLKSIFVR
jgi:hypothetical protein